MIEKIKLLRDIVLILAVPSFGAGAYYLFNESIKLKDMEIQSLQAKNELLNESQISRANEKIKSVKEFYESEIQNTEKIMSEIKHVNDSLFKIVKTPRFIDSTHIVITRD